MKLDLKSWRDLPLTSCLSLVSWQTPKDAKRKKILRWNRESFPVSTWWMKVESNVYFDKFSLDCLSIQRELDCKISLINEEIGIRVASIAKDTWHGYCCSTSDTGSCYYRSSRAFYSPRRREFRRIETFKFSIIMPTLSTLLLSEQRIVRKKHRGGD